MLSFVYNVAFRLIPEGLHGIAERSVGERSELGTWTSFNVRLLEKVGHDNRTADEDDK